tara:strand:+ start:1106 stop:1627 length:522 start_codon:yes stop_codon:yes gene_type:complete
MCYNNSKKEKCVICMENKKIHIKCKLCVDTSVCYNCTTQMCENGQCDRCPICRQENWKNIKTSKTKICIKNITTSIQTTANNITNPQNQQNPTKNECCETTKEILKCITDRQYIYYVVAFLGYSFLFGILTLMFVTSDNNITFKKWEIILYSLLIGIVEVIFLFGCCKFMCCT